MSARSAPGRRFGFEGNLPAPISENGEEFAFSRGAQPATLGARWNGLRGAPVLSNAICGESPGVAAWC
jgi:hypothetical protein